MHLFYVEYAAFLLINIRAIDYDAFQCLQFEGPWTRAISGRASEKMGVRNT